MLAEADRLDRLVSDLLDLARLGAQDFRIDLAEIDLTELVDAAAEVWRARCEPLGVRFMVELPPGPVPVRTDPTRARQILDGLAENALRVTPAERPIVFRVGTASGWGVLEVSDGGPGLTPEDCAVAFERSTLYERYRGVRRVGTGVGLALVHGLATRLGGHAVAGRAPEGGARFTIWLPAPTGSADPPEFPVERVTAQLPTSFSGHPGRAAWRRRAAVGSRPWEGVIATTPEPARRPEPDFRGKRGYGRPAVSSGCGRGANPGCGPFAPWEGANGPQPVARRCLPRLRRSAAGCGWIPQWDCGIQPPTVGGRAAERGERPLAGGSALVRGPDR